MLWRNSTPLSKRSSSSSLFLVHLTSPSTLMDWWVRSRSMTIRTTLPTGK